MRMTALPPRIPRRFSDPNCWTSPTSPTMVRSTPRLTNASPPAVSTSETTALISASVASGAMTTTMGVLPLLITRTARGPGSDPADDPLETTRAPGRWGPGLSPCGLSAQRLADQPPGLVEPEEIHDVAHGIRVADAPPRTPHGPRIWLSSRLMAGWRRHVPPRTVRAAAAGPAARPV